MEVGLVKISQSHILKLFVDLLMSKPKRKLAAIVFTDIVGFTKLTADDQSKASALLKQQREILKPIVESFNGSWVKRNWRWITSCF